MCTVRGVIEAKQEESRRCTMCTVHRSTNKSAPYSEHICVGTVRRYMSNLVVLYNFICTHLHSYDKNVENLEEYKIVIGYYFFFAWGRQ